eukprot:EG_transcript_42257
MATLCCAIHLAQPLPAAARCVLRLFLHDKRLAGAQAGLAAEAALTLPAATTGPIEVELEIDAAANQVGKVASEMVQPAYYLVVESDAVTTTEVPGYSDGAPYFSVDVTQVLEVKLRAK